MLSVEATVTRESESNNLSEYAEKNWKEGCFNDVTIKVENETIAASRMVLASRSVYFEKLFKTDMKEKYQSAVEIKDINGTSVKKLIEFIYTGTIIINNENVLDMLSTSDYLQIDEVKKFCFEFLQSVLSSDTCFDILTIANQYHNEQLKESALDCVKKNMNNVNFSNDLSKNDFVACISNMKGSHQAKESAIFQAIVSWIKHEKINREKEFPELLFLLDFARLEVDYIQQIMLKEELITDNYACLKFVTSKLSDGFKMKRIGSTKVISVGGCKTTKRVIEVYSCKNEALVDYPNAPNEGTLRFAGKFGSTFYVGSTYRSDDCTHLYTINLNNVKAGWNRGMAEKIPELFTLTLDKGVWTYTTNENVRFYLPHEKSLLDGPVFNRIRHYNALVSNENNLYVLGGNVKHYSNHAESRCLSSGEILTAKRAGLIKGGKWEYMRQSMQKPRMEFAAVSCRGEIYAIGGKTGTEKILKSVEKYDPEKKDWTYVSSMSFERQRHAACVLNDKIIVVGGVDGDGVAIQEIECYDPLEDTWSIVGKTKEELFDHFLIAI